MPGEIAPSKSARNVGVTRVTTDQRPGLAVLLALDTPYELDPGEPIPIRGASHFSTRLETRLDRTGGAPASPVSAERHRSRMALRGRIDDRLESARGRRSRAQGISVT